MAKMNINFTPAEADLGGSERDTQLTQQKNEKTMKGDIDNPIRIYSREDFMRENKMSAAVFDYLLSVKDIHDYVDDEGVCHGYSWAQDYYADNFDARRADIETLVNHPERFGIDAGNARGMADNMVVLNADYDSILRPDGNKQRPGALSKIC